VRSKAAGVMTSRPMPSTVVCSIRAAACRRSRLVSCSSSNTNAATLLVRAGGSIRPSPSKLSPAAFLKSKCTPTAPLSTPNPVVMGRCWTSTRPSVSRVVKREPISGGPASKPISLWAYHDDPNQKRMASMPWSRTRHSPRDWILSCIMSWRCSINASSRDAKQAGCAKSDTDIAALPT
jgi:hypothetical protein